MVDRPKLVQKQVALQSVTGEPVRIDGVANISFKIAGLRLQHTFYVVPALNRNIILGRDFLKQNQVRLYFDLRKMRIQNRYVDLDEDAHIMSLVRLRQALVLRPQTTAICHGRLSKSFNMDKAPLIRVSSVRRGHIANEPGLMEANVLARACQSHNLPLMIVNNTDKCMRLRRGCVVAAANHEWELGGCDLGPEIASVRTSNCPGALKLKWNYNCPIWRCRWSLGTWS